jgi:hypothetical protein
MNQIVNHVLSKEGILTTFSIAKKVAKKEILDLQKKLGVTKFKNKKFKNILAEKMFEETRKSFLDQKIPGLIIPGQNIPDEEKKRMMELTYFASIVAKKIGEKKIDKFHSCYIINAIVNMLGLTEGDFDEFHRKFSKYKDGSGSPGLSDQMG